MYKDLQTEIKHLHLEIHEKRADFFNVLKKDTEFKELKNVYLEIKKLVWRLGECCKQLADE